MKSFKKKSLHHKINHDKNITIESISKKSMCKMNFGEYIGRVVTVYVNAGGDIGKGFTGILIEQLGTYIKLLVLPSLPPACSLGNECNGNRTSNILLCLFCPYNNNATMGTMAEISIESIVAFVHSNSRV